MKINLTRLCLCLVLVLMLPACTSKGLKLENSNSLLVNKFGVLCNPQGSIGFDRRKVTCKSEDGNHAYVSTSELSSLVKADLLEAERYAQQNESDKVKLLIYIHGGLNRVTDSLVNNEALKSAITTDEEHWYYPRFFVWPSDGLTNYSEHALNISGGRYTENVVRGLFGGVATLISDSLQAIVNIPRSWFTQAVNVKDHIWALNDRRYLDSSNAITSPFRVSHAWVQARKNYCLYADLSNDSSNCLEGGYDNKAQDVTTISNKSDEDNANIYWSSYERNSRNPLKNPKIVWERVSALSRITVGSLTHSEIGAASWRNMKRRAENITSPTVIFDSRIKERHSCSNNGLTCASGMQYFDELLSQINDSENPGRYELTLIGHSMGAFILNSIINSNLDNLVDHQIVKDVVYMAAATTIQDTVQTIHNLYHAYATRGIDFAQWPQVSNLMLNRVAEISELMFYGLVPSGSLLVWVDEVYERPSHPTERTVGSEVNVYTTLPYIERQLGPYYTNKITFKAFDRTRGSQPAMHGEFNDGDFWHPEFWRLNY